MKIISQFKNGQVARAVKNYKELSDQEKEMIIVPYGTHITDYADFKVQYNREGNSTSVSAGSFSDSMRKRLNDRRSQPDLLDMLAMLTGSKSQAGHARQRIIKATNNPHVPSVRAIRQAAKYLQKSK